MDSLRWEWYGLVLLTLGQIILVLRAPLTGLSDRIWQAWLVGNPALCLAIVTWRPDAWRRHRVWMVPLLRIVTHLVPQQRSSQKGITGLMLGKPPRTGLQGAAMDAVRLVAGMRLIGNVMATLLVPMPLPVAAATNAVVVMLLRNNHGLCHTELLSSPLSRQRLSHLHTLLDACCFMVLPLTPPAVPAGQPGSIPQACNAALNFVQALCILLPVALLVWTQPPPQRSAGSEPSTRGLQQQQQGQQQQGQQQQGQQQREQQLWPGSPQQGQCGWPAELAAAVQRATRDLDCFLRWAFLCEGNWVQRTVHLLVLLDGVWLAIKAYS